MRLYAPAARRALSNRMEDDAEKRRGEGKPFDPDRPGSRTFTCEKKVESLAVALARAWPR